MAGVNQRPQENSEHELPAEEAPQEGQGAVVYHCDQQDQRSVAIKHAQQALASDECVVMPTDTVYGIAANAFSAAAVQGLLEAKGRNRTMPPPVLIAHSGVLDGLADQVSDEARALAQAFWPGGLTLICHAQPSLQWDLGETQGTVALRVPDDDVARELLTESGPLAVSSANRTGLPAATTVDQAREMLQEKVSVYLDAGPRGKVSAGGSAAHPVVTRAPQSSTIVDCTGDTPLVVRDGAITLSQLREVVPSVIGTGGVTEAAGQDSDPATGSQHTATVPDDPEPTQEVDGTAGEDVAEGNAESTGDPWGDALNSDVSAADRATAGSSGDTGGRSTSVDRRQAQALVSSAAGLAVSTTADQTDATQAGPRGKDNPGPDQNRHRTGRAAVPGQPQPVDRATAAALVARGSENGYETAPVSTDQSRR